MHVVDLPSGARGRRDDRAVEPNRPTKSAGSEETYATDLESIAEIRREIDAMARGIAEWLVRKGKTARTVTIKVRYSDFTTITRSDTRRPTSNPDDIQERAVRLLAKTQAGRRPVRLLGAGVHNFEPPEPEPEAKDLLPFESA